MKDELVATLSPTSALQSAGLVEIAHSLPNTSIAAVKNCEVEIPESVQRTMDKRRVELAQACLSSRNGFLATRPNTEEMSIKKMILQKVLSNIDVGDLSKLNSFTLSRKTALQELSTAPPPKLSDRVPPEPPRDTSNDLMMWWGQTSIINTPANFSTFSFEPDGLHLTADVTANDGSAWDGSLTVLAQFYLDGSRIYPKRTSGVTPYSSVPPVEYYGAVHAQASVSSGILTDPDPFGDRWAKLYLNTIQNVIINSELRGSNTFRHTIADFTSDGDGGWSVLPGSLNMPQVNFHANQLDNIEIDLILSLDFIVEGQGSFVQVGRRTSFDYALLLHPQWKIVQTGS
jgi:hypothetical protein